MAFSRTLAPVALESDLALTSAIAAIGMNFAARPAGEANIEDTLLFASFEGMEHDDLRVLAVLVTWFGVYSPWVNADRLTSLVIADQHVRVRALWAAMAKWKGKDRRFDRLSKVYRAVKIDVLRSGSDFHIKRHGEDPRFAGTPIRVAANVLRDRPGDILSPQELAKRNPVFRYRVMMGPSYRADMWALLEGDPSLTASELARSAHGSFATAWHVRKDFALLNAANPRVRGKKKGT